MAHVAGPNGFRFSVTPDTVTFGQFRVPLGKANSLTVWEKDWRGNVANMVRVEATGGMGMGGKDVLLEFHCLTKEKLTAFVHALLRTAGPSFYLQASAIRPSNPVEKPAEDTFVETVEIDFDGCEDAAEEFQSMMAPVFFPRFKAQLAGAVLTLSIEGTKDQVTQATQAAFQTLAQKTYGRSDHLLSESGNPLFPEQPQAQAEAPRLSLSRRYYVISPTQVARKRTYLQDPPPGSEKIGSQWFGQEPIPIVTPEQCAQMRDSKEKTLSKLRTLHEHLPSFRHVLTSLIANLEARFNQGQPRTSFEFAVMTNLLSSATEPDILKLTQEERAFLKTQSEEQKVNS